MGATIIPNWYMAIATLNIHILLQCWLDKIHFTLKTKTNKPKSLFAQKAKAKDTKPKLSHSAQKAKATKPKFNSHKRPSWNSFPKRRPPLLSRNIPPKRRSLKLSGGLHKFFFGIFGAMFNHVFLLMTPLEMLIKKCYMKAQLTSLITPFSLLLGSLSDGSPHLFSN